MTFRKLSFMQRDEDLIKHSYALFCLVFFALISGCTTYNTEFYKSDYSQVVQIGDRISVATRAEKYHSFVITDITENYIAGDNIKIDSENIKRITVHKRALDGGKILRVGGYILLAVFVAALLDFKGGPGGVTVGP